jgi:hypothetical protein
MKYKHILVSDDLHRKVKIAASMTGRNIRAFVENALIRQLATLGNGDGSDEVIAGYLAGQVTAEEAMEVIASRQPPVVSGH